MQTLPNARRFSIAGIVLLVPILIIWIAGFLSQGAHIAVASAILSGFHRQPKFLQLCVEVVFPAAALFFGILAVQNHEKKSRTIPLIVISVLLLLMAILALLFAPQV